MKYDFKNTEEKKKINEVTLKVDHDDSNVVEAIAKMEIAVSNAIAELQTRVDSLELTTNVTTEKHEHTIETKEVNLEPVIEAIAKAKTEVNVEKFDDSAQLGKLEAIADGLSVLSKKLDLIEKQQARIPVQKAGKKTDPSEYVPVRLTTGGRFYNALSEMVSAIEKSNIKPDVDISYHANYVKKFYTSTGAVTDGIIWSPASGKRWHIVSMYIQSSAISTITIEEDRSTGDDPIWKAEFIANEGMTINFSDNYPLAGSEDGSDLLVTTTDGNIYITITGYEI